MLKSYFHCSQSNPLRNEPDQTSARLSKVKYRNAVTATALRPFTSARVHVWPLSLLWIRARFGRRSGTGCGGRHHAADRPLQTQLYQLRFWHDTRHWNGTDRSRTGCYIIRVLSCCTFVASDCINDYTHTCGMRLVGIVILYLLFT